MAKYFTAIIIILAGLFLAPFIGQAATVTLDADTNLDIWGVPITLTLKSGSTFGDMTVYSTYIVFTTETDSSITIQSDDKKVLHSSNGENTTCGSGYSEITIAPGAVDTITVTPKTTECGGSTGGGGGGGTPADTTAPSISNIAETIGDTFATIIWQTNESSLTWLNYGASTSYGSEVKGTTYISSHSAALTGLLPETAYHYQVKSKDSAGNTGSYTDRTFTTLATGEEATTTEQEEEEEEEEEEIAPTPTKPISQMTVVELKAEVVRITALIAQLQTELLKMVSATGELLTKNLKYNDSGDQVRLLQKWLASDKSVYPAGTVSGWFGPLTKAAVIKFQEKYGSEVLAPIGLKYGTGIVGAMTRAKLNSLYGAK